jgi:hypothetical protein
VGGEEDPPSILNDDLTRWRLRWQFIATNSVALWVSRGRRASKRAVGRLKEKRQRGSVSHRSTQRGGVLPLVVWPHGLEPRRDLCSEPALPATPLRWGCVGSPAPARSTTATLGFFLGLAVTLACMGVVKPE